MGLPELKIAFSERVRMLIPQAGYSTVLLLVKDNIVDGLHEYNSLEDVNDKFNPENKKYIEDIFSGSTEYIRVGGVIEKTVYKPDKLIVYSIKGEQTLDNALVELENTVFDYIVMPSAEEDDNAKIINFIGKLKDGNLESSAILVTSKASDSKDIIEFFIEDFEDGGVNYTSKDLICKIAGILASIPLYQSPTYQIVDGISKVPTKTKDQIGNLIDAGKLTLINKGGFVRIARGVTSLKDTQHKFGDSFKKIKLVRIYKYINNTISDVITNFYVGKVPNNYYNKLVLITEIKEFLEGLKNRELIEGDFSVEIDLDAQKKYLKGRGINIASLSEDQIKSMNTGSKVFLKITLKAVDAMEDFNIEVEV